MCEVHWIETRKQILHHIHIASLSRTKSSLIIKWVMSKNKREIIDNIILDIQYISIAFFFFKIDSKYLFQSFSAKVKTYFKILYIYTIEFESLESIFTYWALHFWPNSLQRIDVLLGQAKFRWYVVNVLLKVEKVSWEKKCRKQRIVQLKKWDHLVDKNTTETHIDIETQWLKVLF